MPRHAHRLNEHIRTCAENPDKEGVVRQYKMRAYKKRGAYKKSKQAEKQEEKREDAERNHRMLKAAPQRQEVEDSSEEDLMDMLADWPCDSEVTPSDSEGKRRGQKRKRQEKQEEKDNHKMNQLI